MSKLRVDANPQKDFVIHQLTRDISLTDCILDLVDNTIDGVHNYFARRKRPLSDSHPYRNYRAYLNFSQREFSISDNCEGIPVETARKYAFTFGRALDYPTDAKGMIGQYGIGLKRAVFKMGDDITISSSTRTESFELHIDVPEWAKKDEWELELEPGPALDASGTTITVRVLKDEVRDEFAQPSFVANLKSILARDYSFILPKGFNLRVNGKDVAPALFRFKIGKGFHPLRAKFKEAGVDVDVTAGMIGPQPEDSDPGAVIAGQDRFGWFVMCNNRVVIASDKEEKTGWGTDGVPTWHPQYSGFCGIASLHSDDASKLPWTTTKRDIEQSSAVYQKALGYMRQAAKEYVKYTNLRKGSEEDCRRREAAAPYLPLDEVPIHSLMEFPIPKKEKKENLRSISYKKPDAQFVAVAEALGNRAMAGKIVGEKTFDYFYENRIGKLR